MARGGRRTGNTMKHKKASSGPRTGRSKHGRLQGLGRIGKAGAPAFKGGRGGPASRRHF